MTRNALKIAMLALLLGSMLPGQSQTVRAQTPSAAPAMDPSPLETAKIHDLTATLEVNDDETNLDELGKISATFGQVYRVQHNVTVSYAFPNKARFDTKALGQTISLIYNGDQKEYHTPIKSGVLNTMGQPGQKQSLLDLGIFARDYLTTDYKPNFVKKDGPLYVFNLTQRNSTNGSHEVVWVDPKTSITVKRQSFNGDGKLTKELRYTKPAMIRPGIYVPTRIEVWNQFGKLGGVQDVSDIKVNLGVDENLFSIS